MVVAAALLWLVFQDQVVQPRQLPTPHAAQRQVPADPVRRQEAAPDRLPVEVAAPPPTSATSPVAAASTVLRGTLLLEDGSPVAGASCAWSIQGVDRSVSGHVPSDGEGRFRIPGPADLRGPRLLRIRTCVASVEPAWGYTEMVIAPEYPPGEHDLGFLLVEPLPHLVSGRVVDVGGALVSGARVYAMPDQPELTALGDAGYAERLSALVDARGRFAVYGRLAGGTVRLVVRQPAFFQLRPVVVKVGEVDALVEIGAAAGLAGSVLTGPVISSKHLAVELTGPAVVGHLGVGDGPLPAAVRPRAEGESVRIPVQSDGTFEIDGLRPGWVDVAVHCLGVGKAVAAVPSVSVPAGAVGRDSRLQSIDLRHLRGVPLRLVDEAGRGVAGLAVGVRDVGVSAWERMVSDPDGRVMAVTGIGAVDVLVQDGGFQRQLLSDVRGERVITLAQGLPLTLAFELGEQVPGFEVSAQLVGGERTVSPASVQGPRSALQWLQESHPMEFCVPEPGLYRIEVTVRVRGGPALHARQVVDLDPLEVLVPPGGSSGTLPVRLGADAIGKAVRQIRYFFPTAGILR